MKLKVNSKINNPRKAKRLGYRVDALLKESRFIVKIHSVFDHAINFLAIDDWIITLLPENYPVGPQTIILYDGDFYFFKTITFPSNGFKFKDFINVEDSNIIPRKIVCDKDKMNVENIRTNTEYFSQLLYEKGNKNGLIGKDNEYYKYALPFLDNFRVLFKQKEFQGAFCQLQDLIGLGAGLTPSGDDFILGVMAAFYFLGLYEGDIQKTMTLTVKKARKKTNLISYNMLRQGAAGGFIEWIEDMTFALIYEDIKQVNKAFLNMIKIGGSSGSDISAGILFGISIILEANLIL